MHIEKLQIEYAVRVSALTLCLLLCAGPSVAVAVQSPYDDAPGVLDDGQMHVYYVEDDAGDPVRIAVHKNLPLSTVRISFDDEDPFSAPVDVALSGVTLAPATIPADGNTTALVTIFPRDAAGVPLGTGLDISLDGSALWPGSLLGPVTDEGNGLYTARILSSAPGRGDAWVTVEGILLSAEPSVTYESTSGPLSLRDRTPPPTSALRPLISILPPNGGFRWVPRAEYGVLNSAEIMSAMVDRIGCKPNVFNEDGVYRRDRWRGISHAGFRSGIHMSPFSR